MGHPRNRRKPKRQSTESTENFGAKQEKAVHKVFHNINYTTDILNYYVHNFAPFAPVNFTSLPVTTLLCSHYTSVMLTNFVSMSE